MSRTPRETLLNTARVLREQAEVIHGCKDYEDLAQSLDQIQQAVDELRASPIV